MLTIWFIGMYVIFIIQQITILYLVSRGDKKWIIMLYIKIMKKKN